MHVIAIYRTQLMPGSNTPALLEALTVDVAAMRRRSVTRHRVDAVLESSWLSLVLQGTDAVVSDPGHVEATLEIPIDGAVVAHGRLRFRFSVPCGRCLAPATIDCDAPLEATFVEGDELPSPSGAPGEDDEEPGLGLGDRDLDTWSFDGRLVHLDEAVGELVKVAYPMRALCERGEACRGLCSQCGLDWNASPGPPCPACGATPIPDERDGSTPNAFAAALRKLQFPD